MQVIIEQEFIEIVRDQLDQRNWSRAELARQMGTDGAYVSRYLSGKIAPGPDVIERFFRAFGLKPHLSYTKQEEALSVG
ncbi:MAG: helix-turn-helix transcriptional regulator [Planctomycetota bacterium]